jgi:hypothetical protein
VVINIITGIERKVIFNTTSHREDADITTATTRTLRGTHWGPTVTIISITSTRHINNV